MLWKKPKDDTLTIQLNGSQTIEFKNKADSKDEGVKLKFYGESFREKPQPSLTKSMAKVEHMTHPKKETRHAIPETVNPFFYNETTESTKKETMERLFGMSLDDLALKLNTLEFEREESRKIIENYAKSEEATLDFLEKMLKKELYLNKEIAEPVLIQYEVHPEHKLYQKRLSRPKDLVEALFYIQHCHRADIQEMMQNVRIARQENRTLGFALEEMQQNQQQLEDAKRQTQEKMQTLMVDFKEKYASMQEEYKKKVNEAKQVSKQNEHLQKQLTSLEKELLQKHHDLEEVRTKQVAFEHEPTEPIALEEMEIPDEAFLEGEAESEATEVETQTRLAEMEETTEMMPVDFAFLHESEDENVQSIEEEAPYIALLKEKGYTVEPSTNLTYDWVVAKETEEKIPLMYIYYDIDKAEEFDNLMKDTDKIYFVFDSKKRKTKGNTRFTSWLLKQKDRKKNIHFSFTTVEELQTNGLKGLDNL